MQSMDLVYVSKILTLPHAIVPFTDVETDRESSATRSSVASWKVPSEGQIKYS